MANEFGINSHSVIAMGEFARVLQKIIRFSEELSNEKLKMADLSNNEELKQAVFGDGSKEDIKAALSKLNVKTDNQKKSFNEISVRLFKGYMAPSISDAMTHSKIGCVRMVKNDDGMIAVIYNSADEEKMADALRQMEVNLGASTVVDIDTLQKMAAARGKPELYEVNNLSYADVARFEYASQRFSMNIAISEDETSSSDGDPKFKVTVMSSDEKKVNKVLRDVAISKTATNADAFDRSFSSMQKTIKAAAEKAVSGEKFYVCSPTRKHSFIEVTKDGFKVISQKGSDFKVAKEVDGGIGSSRVFNDFAHELRSFENPVLLTEDEFSEDPQDRLAETLGKIETLEQEDVAKAFVTEVTSKALMAANSCGQKVYNISSLTSEKFFDKVEASKFIEDKESVYVAIATLKNLPPQMVNKVIAEYRDRVEEMENSVCIAEELNRDDKDVDAPTPPNEPAL